MATEKKLTVTGANVENMPAAPDDTLAVTRMPLALRAFFDDALFNRLKTIALYLSRARGITPQHLLGQEEACFSVAIDSLNWRLSPSMVARATYQTPEGKIGYEGKLVSAILQQSGALIGGIDYEMIGDWDRVTGKFKLQRNEKTGKSYPVKTYTDADEQGLGVTVRAQLRNESEPRVFTFMLPQAYPRFSTLWATDPQTQIKYAAIRRFASVATPQLIFGIPFDRDSQLEDITPAGVIDLPGERPRTARAALDSFAGSGAPEQAQQATSGYDEETGEVTDAVDPTPKPAQPEPVDPKPNPAPKPAEPLPAQPKQAPQPPDPRPPGEQAPYPEQRVEPQPEPSHPEVPVMPTAYLEDWERRGEWPAAWRWLQARIAEQQVPEIAQALAEQHIHLLRRVGKHNRSYKTSVISTLQKAQVEVDIEA